MKIVLFGKDGQVGRAILARRPDVIGFGRYEADFENPASVGAFVERERPDVIINAAGYTAVDAAEADRDRAWAINAGAVEAIGTSAKKSGALVVHYSTDYVFPGTADGYQSESEPTSPLSVYGASKLAGEALLAQSGARHVILRTGWVYAPRGTNFPLTILRLAKEREQIDVVSDQVGAPTPADLIADVTAQIIDGPHTGLYHLAPSGETSWHALAQFIVTEALAAGAKLRLTPEAIRPILSRDYPAKAQRPANSRLDTTKLRTTFNLTLPPWQDGIRQLIKTLRQEGRL